jgi:hypothetical protein
MSSNLIDPTRLDLVLSDVRRTTSEAVTRTRLETFEALLPSRARRRSAFDGASLREEVEDLAMPRITDPTIFKSSRYLAILEQLAFETIHAVGDNEETRNVALSVIDDEIGRHRDLQKRLNDE